jgi:hypothetical protein
MQKRKRVVTKLEYVAYLAGKTTLNSGSFLLWCGGVLLAVIAVLCGMITLYLLATPNTWIGALGALFLTLILGGGAWLFIQAGMGAGSIAEEMEPVLPPTRRNIEQLAAEETLVRASTEPTVEQKQVLLRAATGTDQTPPEQLLRPGTLPEG